MSPNPLSSRLGNLTNENPALFYAANCAAVIVFGPTSILSLWGLKRQVKTLGEKEDEMNIL